MILQKKLVNTFLWVHKTQLPEQSWAIIFVTAGQFQNNPAVISEALACALDSIL